MTTDFFLVRHRSARMLISGRWIVLCLASVLLHIWAINWANGNIRLPSLHDKTDTAIVAVLHPAPVTAAPALPIAAPAPQAKAPRRRKARPAAPPLIPAAPPENIVMQADAGMAIPDAGIASEPALPVSETALTAATEADEQAPAPPSSNQLADAMPEPAGAHYKVNPPPSVVLNYDVTKVPAHGNPTYGHGSISWHSAANNYVINGEAGILFITALTFKSEGAIDDFGVAPLIYSEKRFRKSETNTHFHRERNTISFSASTTSYPRQGGEQDRASIVWQLAGIGRGDSKKFAPDASIDIFVAGVRDGETWRIHVIGQEEIEVGAGKMTAWHVVRVPKPGSYDQKLDIWLAPQHEWYPVKLRYTETNGDYLDMSLSDMRIAANH